MHPLSLSMTAICCFMLFCFAAAVSVMFSLVARCVTLEQTYLEQDKAFFGAADCTLMLNVPKFVALSPEPLNTYKTAAVLTKP